jgi:glycosyltransferase involved in cell wall biosynthesis
VTVSRRASPGGIRARLARSGHRARTRALRAIAARVYQRPVSPRPILSSWLAYAVRYTNADVVGSVVAANLAAHGPRMLQEHARAAMGQIEPKQLRVAFFMTVWSALQGDVEAAVAFGDAFIDDIGDRKIAATLVRMLADRGAIERPLLLIERHRIKAPQLEKELRQDVQLLRQGHTMPLARPRVPRADRRVLYFVSQSRPHHTSGYAIRTHWLLQHLAAQGWDATAVARFGYPTDRADHKTKGDAAGTAEVDGVRYRFTPDRTGFRDPSVDYLQRATRDLLSQAADLRPALIHAASNYQVGLAGVAAARMLGVPSIYEVRGLWHLTRTSKDPAYADSDHYRMSERLEVEAAAAADHVFVITRSVMDLLAERGVPQAKMSLLPNAVDTGEFAPRARDEELAAALGVTGKVVIGTVGTFKWYEGLDLLLDAAAAMRRSLGDRFRILLVGDGPQSDELAAQRARLGLEEVVVMTGRVPHDQVQRYYSLLDIAAYPRTGARVCHFVSPLKPLEAMAMEKAVVVSDVKAQTEMIEHERTGLVHRADDARALETALTRLVEEPALRAQLGARARAWVQAHRSWPSIAASVTSVYDRLAAT